MIASDPSSAHFNRKIIRVCTVVKKAESIAIVFTYHRYSPFFTEVVIVVKEGQIFLRCRTHPSRRSPQLGCPCPSRLQSLRELLRRSPQAHPSRPRVNHQHQLQCRQRKYLARQGGTPKGAKSKKSKGKGKGTTMPRGKGGKGGMASQVPGAGKGSKGIIVIAAGRRRGKQEVYVSYVSILRVRQSVWMESVGCARRGREFTGR